MNSLTSSVFHDFSEAPSASLPMSAHLGGKLASKYFQRHQGRDEESTEDAATKKSGVQPEEELAHEEESSDSEDDSEGGDADSDSGKISNPKFLALRNSHEEGAGSKRRIRIKLPLGSRNSTSGMGSDEDSRAASVDASHHLNSSSEDASRGGEESSDREEDSDSGDASTASSEDASGAGDDSEPAPHMHQPPLLREPSTVAGDEDVRRAQRFDVVLSALSLLLLQLIESPCEANAFPHMLSLPVNNRVKIDPAKLTSPFEKRNILLRFIENRNRDIPPISGDIHVVLFSFSYNPDGGLRSDLTSLCTHDSSQLASKFNVKEMTTDDCERILKWLDGSTVEHEGEGALEQGKRMILEKLGNVPLYGTSEMMAKWFSSKLWNNPGAEELAQQARQTIQQMSDGVIDDDVARLALRNTIVKMFPYQTQMACAPLDGVHRMATVLCASTGACPPGTGAELRLKLIRFTKSLTSTRPDGSGMGVPSTDNSNEVTIDVNTPPLSLFDWGGQRRLSSELFQALRKKSQRIQEYACSADGHTAKSVIGSIMSSFVEKLDEGPGCLFDSDPMDSALAGWQDPAKPNDDQKKAQVEAFLGDVTTRIPEGVRRDHLKSLRDSWASQKNWGSAMPTITVNITPSCGPGAWQDTSKQF